MYCGGEMKRTSDASGTIDPVCHMTVQPAESAGSHVHGGQTYFFCSKDCLQAFKSDPMKYLQKETAGPTPQSPGSSAQESPAALEIDSVVIYTCPMHPEVRQKGPGSCP